MAKTPTQLRSEAACKTVLKNLERRGFEAFYCSDKPAALDKALELISEDDVVSWGGSVTIQEIGLLDVMRRQLVNIDGTGNRVAAMVYGPKSVIVIAGINKIVKTQDDALARVRMLAAPINVQRFPQLKTPCMETGLCADCNAPDCICNYILITRRCKPKGKIKVILVGESLGY